MWLSSHAIHVTLPVRPASASRHASVGLWPVISVPTGCAVVYRTDVRLKKGERGDEATMAHTTITVSGVIDVFGVFLEAERRSGIDLFTVMAAG